MQLGDFSSVVLNEWTGRGSVLVRVTQLGHKTIHMNTLVWGLFELLEIGFLEDSVADNVISNVTKIIA